MAIFLHRAKKKESILRAKLGCKFNSFSYTQVLWITLWTIRGNIAKTLIKSPFCLMWLNLGHFERINYISIR